MKTPLLVATALFALTAMAQVPGNVPTAGLVAWYPLNNSVLDAGPNALNGTASGITAAADRFGNAGAASGFSGFSFGQVPSNALFNTGTGMTVTAWVQLTNANANQKVLGRVNGSFNTGFILGVENGAVHPEVWNSAGVAHSLSAGFIPSGQWTHVAITWASSGYLVVYVNSMAADSMAVEAAGIGVNSEPLIIGGSPWSTNPLYFSVTGSIDDIGIWNRALTPGEVQAVFSSGTSGIGSADRSHGAALYPVPAQSTVSIRTAPELAGQPFQFVDAMGRTVLQGQLANDLTAVGVENLSPGIYSVRLGNIKATTLRFVKQ